MAIATYDPMRSFKFHVTLVGVGEIGFQKVSGLKESSDVVEYREGNMEVWKRKLPGLTNFEPITLTRGSAPRTVASQLFDWRALVARVNKGTASGLSSIGDGVPSSDPIGGGFRKQVEISVYNKGEPNTIEARFWRVHLAWPSELSVSDLNAEASEMLIDTLVLQHEGLDIIVPAFANSAPPVQGPGF